MTPEPLCLQDFSRRYTPAWCSQTAARVAAFYSLSGSLSVNSATPAVGHEAIKEVVQDFMAAFPDTAVLIDGLDVVEIW